jgi:penicillin-binding protein 2
MEKHAKNQDPFIVQEGKLKFSKLKDSYHRAGWIEDSFLSGDSERETVGRSFDLSKLKLITWFIIFFFGVLLIRIFSLQVVKGDEYYDLAQGNRLRVHQIAPKRGVIYDRNLNPLVQNGANFILYLTPIDLPKSDYERNEIIRKVSNLLSYGPELRNQDNAGDISLVADSPYFAEISAALDNISDPLVAYQPLFVADNIPYDTALLLYLEADKLPGVIITNQSHREYINSGALSLSHVLGYTGKVSSEELEKYGQEYSLIDYIGKTGIERFWESELRGTSGKKHIEVDALGKEKKVVSQIPALDGHNLKLSLDLELQQTIEAILQTTFQKIGEHKASVIALDPNNGEVLALVSWPTYNNNDFSKGISPTIYQSLLDNEQQPLFNRAISGEVPSGSTIKPVISLAALAEGVINENTSFLSVGGIRIGQWFFPDWKAGGHGVTNVKKAIAESVNTFFYYIGGGFGDFKGLGLEKIVDYLKAFGIGTQTGIDIPGEANGFVPTEGWKKEAKDELWYIGDTYHLAIGQGDLLVTPLQVANYTAFFANGGTLYRPHLVKEILDADNNLYQSVPTEIVKDKIASQENIEIVRQGMRQAVSDGSARRLQSIKVPVAGKTGTAQWSSQKPNHAWFTGFAPFDNSQISLTILIEEGGEGSVTAVPIAEQVFYWYFNNR